MQNKYYFITHTYAIAILLVMVVNSSAISQSTLIHFWHFDESIPNDIPLTSLDATYGITDETAAIEYQSALAGYPFNSDDPNWRKASMERRNYPTPINYRPIANVGLPYNEDTMRGLQVKQPFTGDGGENTMIFHLPTTGFNNIVFMFAAVDEGAAEELIIDYSVHPSEIQWISDGLTTTVYPLQDNHQLFTVDFSDSGDNIIAANDNPHFMVRIRFQGSNMAADDDNRVTFNNISLDGMPLNTINLPPFIANPLDLEKMIENQTAEFDLGAIFTDPDNDPLEFSATSDRPDIVQAQVNGNTLSLTALNRGDANITLTASDDENTPTIHQFRVLLYPQAFSPEQGDFTFSEWSNAQPEYAFPENMLFLQSDKSDPDVSYELLYPYYIPHDDYHADDQQTIGFPYNNTRRTRINGLGTGGVSFINTGRERDLGGVLVALNTTGETDLRLSFLAGTMLQNSRIYAFRLQYRIGTQGAFNNVLINGLPVEYVAGNDGDLMSFENLPLPSILLGHEYVQLLWRFYLYSGDTGPRSMLRLDDITFTRVSTVDEVSENGLTIYSAQGNILINNSGGENAKVAVFSITGQQLFSGNLTGEGLHRISGKYLPGVYIVKVLSGNRWLDKKLIIH